ncbi:MAG: sensor histidine kinase [Salibacteraceae bacterium]
MKRPNQHISVFIYILMGYTIVQFFWWTYLIFELNAEIIGLEKIIVQLAESSDIAQLIIAKGDLDSVFFKKKMMILGESGVFLVILLIGFYLIKSSHQKEIELAKQEQNFMLAITHELNSPLAAIKLNIETLQRRKLDAAKIGLVLERTAQESERLNHLINNILATSRMEKTGFELYPEEIDLGVHIGKLMAKYELLIPQKINYHGQQTDMVNVDVLSFELILQNLLENASKYSDNSTEIDVNLTANEGCICLEVLDQGYGISDKEKQKVLTKFYRIGNEDTRKSKGTGLGLYLVSNLVLEMKGKLAILNNSPKGTIFKIEIPV